MFYFQAYEIFSSHSAKIISFPGFFLSFIGLSSWLLYGVLIKNTPLIIANAVGVIGTILNSESFRHYDAKGVYN